MTQTPSTPGSLSTAARTRIKTGESMIALTLALASVTAGCAAHPSPSPAPVPAVTPDLRTTAILLKIATGFNNDYDSGRYGPTYDRWDARSQAVITRADYIQRHTDCPSAPQTAGVEDATPGPGGAWLVDYQIDGVQLRDYWFYQHGRWVFDLILSNPSSVRLYKMTPQQYAAAQDCAH